MKVESLTLNCFCVSLSLEHEHFSQNYLQILLFISLNETFP